MSKQGSMTPYVKAFSELVSSEEDFLAGVNEFEQIHALIWSEKQIKDMLCSPSVNRTWREETMMRSLKSVGVSELVAKVFVVMLAKGRINQLPEFIYQLREFADERCGILRGSVQTVVKLNETTQKGITALMSKLTGKNADLQYETKEELLGGIRVCVKNVVLDASLKNKLTEAQAKLLGKRA
ncbi:MAG: ATP synthase F1 subunit delta [Planctomycetes bacterium]|nr:ATP synthase F1 subunit delta [Planctomycetota bacterium]